MKVRINFNVLIQIDQYTEMTEGQYKKLSQYFDDDICEIKNGKTNPVYDEIKDLINWDDILDIGDFEAFEIRPWDDEKKQNHMEEFK